MKKFYKILFLGGGGGAIVQGASFLGGIFPGDISPGGIFPSTVYKLGLLFLMEVARYIHNTKNRKFVIYLQHILRVLQKLFCFIVMQNF